MRKQLLMKEGITLPRDVLHRDMTTPKQLPNKVYSTYGQFHKYHTSYI